jgi:hypothetical protein
MATYNVTAQTRRVQYTGDGTAGNFAFSFQINATSELKVYVDSTEKTETTHYTVTLNSGTGAGTVAFTSGNFPTSSETVTLLSDIPLSRTSIYTSGGQLTASSLEDDFDTNMFIHQQTNEEIDRSLRLAEHDVISGADMTLPVKATRAGKILGFNETTGNPEATFTTADGQTLSDIASDISTLADLEDGTVATNALSDLASISSDITTVAGISSSDLSNVATNAAAISTNATNITAIQNASTNATLAENYAIKTDGAVESSNYSSKAWALGGTGVTDTAGSGASKEWATDTTNTVDGTEYSAKEYAIGTQSGQTNGSSKQWAIGGGAGFDVNTTVNGSEYSAKYYAELAAASVDSFDDTYLGAKSSDPSVDNDGDALSTGDLYFNTVSNILRVYNGSSWQDAATDTSTFAGQGFAVAMAIAL